MKRRTRFISWCKRDPKDERSLDYTFTTSEGEVMRFTSDTVEVDLTFLQRIGQAWIDSIELIDEVWHVKIYEDREV